MQRWLLQNLSKCTVQCGECVLRSTQRYILLKMSMQQRRKLSRRITLQLRYSVFTRRSHPTFFIHTSLNVLYFQLLKECPNKLPTIFEQLEIQYITKEVQRQKNPILHSENSRLQKSSGQVIQ